MIKIIGNTQNFKFVSTVLLIFFINSAPKAQVIFSETFGQSAVRLTSPYMPSSSFTWGNPTGTPDQRMVENNHYTVVAPVNIRDAWPIPNYWFWTGPQPIGNTGGDAGNPATNDHTGDADGAVLVINAGNTLNIIYTRPVTLVPGNSYRFSFWMYSVNSGSQVELKIRDRGTNAQLGSSSTGFVSSTDSWIQYTYSFKLPISCTGTEISASLENGIANTFGNDYYIDDILLETIVPGAEPDIICPTTVLPVRLTNFEVKEINKTSYSIHWRSEYESAIKSYTIERSFDGKNFTPVQTIAPEIFTTPRAYKFTDNLTSRVGSKLFYRLAISEMDGSVKYSSVKLLVISEDDSRVVAYPQPATNGTVQVSWSGTGTNTIKLLNTGMQLVNKWDRYTGNSISITNLNPGTYFLQITSEKGNLRTIKIVSN